MEPELHREMGSAVFDRRHQTAVAKHRRVYPLSQIANAHQDPSRFVLEMVDGGDQLRSSSPVPYAPWQGAGW
jgi:hypothetical protein